MSGELQTLQNIVLVLFGCLLILAALVVMDPDADVMCSQHRKPKSKCKDEHRP